jgi:hypothetical protein
MLKNNEIDLKLQLLSGNKINVDENVGHIEPLTMREIINYGYSEYLMRLHFISLNLSNLVGDVKEAEEAGINMFDIILHHGDGDINSEFENSLSFFLKESVQINKDAKIVIIGDKKNRRYIDRDNFEKVREVIKWQNCLNKFGENDEESTESDSVRRIKEKMNKGRELVEQAKKGEGEENGIDIFDIISSVSSKSNSLNKINVFDLTLYQLYDEFKRLELIEQYDIGIKSMLAGAKDVKLKHWSTKVDW